MESGDAAPGYCANRVREMKKPMKVLVVDDDQDQLDIRCMLFSQHGFNPIPAATEAAALRVAAKEKPACAVLDLRLPTPEVGLRLIRGLKKQDPRLTILALTGASIEEFLHRPEAQLVERVFIKGGSAKALIEVLNRTSAQGIA
jgi:DNA-binding NtrC family response regulator